MCISLIRFRNKLHFKAARASRDGGGEEMEWSHFSFILPFLSLSASIGAATGNWKDHPSPFLPLLHTHLYFLLFRHSGGKHSVNQVMVVSAFLCKRNAVRLVFPASQGFLVQKTSSGLLWCLLSFPQWSDTMPDLENYNRIFDRRCISVIWSCPPFSCINIPPPFKLVCLPQSS